MKNGIIRQIDDLRRITVPIQYVKELQWDTTSPILLYTEDDKIILQSLKNKCIFCGKEATQLYHGKPICDQCLRDLRGELQ